jgi:hypothetical protein
MVPIAKKRKIVQDFQSSLSADTLATFVCGSCSARTLVKDQKHLRIKDFDLSLLRRPDYDAPESNNSDDMESDAGMDIDDNWCYYHGLDLVDNTEGDNQAAAVLPAVPLPWLNPECVQPPLPYDDPMPFDSDGNFEGILFDPDGIGSDDDGDTVLLTCKTCSSSLKRGKVPRLSIANYNYLGPVPPELQELTVIEEAMIARWRAKCWIIQLKEEDDYSTPITQRGVRGHVIVYPQRPSEIAKVLPPSIDDVMTPICVIFVGSNPPTSEWLKKKAKPLTVRKEKVLNALAWLKTHNPLYKDIEINASVFDGQPDETIFPFHVQHVVPSGGIVASTSSYVPESDIANSVSTTPNSLPVLSDILNPPASAPIPFDSVVVTNVEGHTSPNELRKAAIDHLKMPGKNYIGIPHDTNPVNEFKNPALFPMIYPTLYPYGLGAARIRGVKPHYP